MEHSVRITGRLLASLHDLLHDPRARIFGLGLAACGALAPSPGQAQTLIAWGDNTFGKTTVPADAVQAVAFSAGQDHSLAIRPDGTVAAWGANNWGQCNVPLEATNVVAVAAGSQHSLALRADGTVLSWGVLGLVTNVPPAATNLIALAAIDQVNMALRQDGTVVSWDMAGFATFVPPQATNVIAMSAGRTRSLALRADGTTLMWDYSGHRVSSLPSSAGPTMALAGGLYPLVALGPDGVMRTWGGGIGVPFQARMPWQLNDVSAVSVYESWGSLTALALRGDGTVAVWGRGALTNVPASLLRVQAIAAGERHALALRGDGRPRITSRIHYANWASAGAALPLAVLAVGDGPLTYQWLADGVPIEGATDSWPRIPAILGTDATEYRVVVSNALGSVTSPAVKVAVRPLHAWGRNSQRQIEIPFHVEDPLAVAAGGFHSLALQPDGSVVAWGKNADGQADVPSAACVDVVAVAAGGDHSLALKADGTVVGWGRDWFGQTTPPPFATNVVALSAGWAHSLALRADGTVVAWGNNDYGQGIASFLATEVTAIACGYYHNLALRADGLVVGWGLNGDSPPEATNVTAIAAGFEHSLALRADGTVLAWGESRYGQATVPESATNVVAIAAGFYHSLAVKADGTVVVWGKPVFGMVDYARILAGVRQVAAGEDHSLALVDTGRASFGRNLDSVSTFLGGPVVLYSAVQAPREAGFQWVFEGVPLNGATNRNLHLPHAAPRDAGRYQLIVTTSAEQVVGPPIQLVVNAVSAASSAVGAWGDSRNGKCAVPVTALNPVAIAAGGFHGLALLPDATVVAWGKNINGQATVPPSATHVIAIAAGGDHSLALRQDGTVVGWGRDWDGQARPPAAATEVRAIAAGWAHSVALRGDGTVVVWGNNDYGQLDVPPEATNLVAIAAGHYHTLALRADRTLVAWGWDESVPENAHDIVALAAGWGHSLAVRSDGTILAWGENGAGQIDIPAAATNVIAVAAGVYHSMALRGDGTVLAWGRNFEGVTEVPWPLRHASAIAAGEDFCLALTQTGTPRIDSVIAPSAGHVGGAVLLTARAAGTYPFQFQWFRDGVALPGETGRSLSLSALTAAQAGNYSLRVTNPVGSTESAAIPLAVLRSPRLANYPAHVVKLPHDPVCLSAAVEGEGPWTYQWLRDGQPVVDGPDVSGAQMATLCLNDPRIAQSGFYSLAVNNAHGSTTGLVAVLAVTPIIAWGDHSEGQLLVTPMTVAPVALAAGAGHSLALLADGTVRAWGDNSLGQCDVPPDLRGVVAVAAGESHSVALLGDGTVRAWGDDESGQSTIRPQATNGVAIAAGSSTTVLLRGDGTALAWGAGIQGLNGVLTRAPTASPVVGLAAGPFGLHVVLDDGSIPSLSGLPQAPSIGPARSASLGLAHGLAVGWDGVAQAWGANHLGQSSVPTDATNVVMVAAGGGGSLALRGDGTVLAWGDAVNGQTQVPEAATNIVAIARGAAHNLALRVSDELPITLRPANLAVFAGERVEFGPMPAAPPFHQIQWLRNGVPLADATQATLGLDSARWEDRGAYQMVGTWPFATLVSEPAILTVRRYAFAIDGELVFTSVAESSGPATVSIQNPFPGGRAFYSTDGSDPEAGGLAYATPFVLANSSRLRCVLVSADASERLHAESLTVLIGGAVAFSADTAGGGTVIAEPAGPFVNRGAVVTVTAQPAPGWTFLHWAGDADGWNPVLELAMNRSKSVRAVFGTTLLTETSGDGSVRVTPPLPLHPYGSEVFLTGVPADGNGFIRWEGAASGDRNPVALTMTAAGLTARAAFANLNPGATSTNYDWYALDVGTVGQGSVLVFPRANRYRAMRAVTLIPVPDPGQQFVGWTGNAHGSSQPYSLVMYGPKSVTAVFTRNVSLRPAAPPEDPNLEGMRFEVLGASGDVYEVQRAGFLPDWAAAGLLTNWTGQATFTDPAPVGASGFYRVLVR